MKKMLHIKNSTKVDPERRTFLQNSLKVLSALAILEIGGAGLLFLRARSLEGEFGGGITAGGVGDFPEGSVTEFDQGNFYLVRADDGGFMAMDRRCPHLGCMIEWVPEKDKFGCPCHAASFDKNGDFQNQIAARALDTFPVFFEKEMVKVDTSRLVTRERHTIEQVSYPH